MSENRSSYRPSFTAAAILLLVALILVSLVFVTFRQISRAEARQLRLLAGLSERVEDAVPDLAQRLKRIVDEQPKHSEIKKYIGAVPNLDYFELPDAKSEVDSDAESAADSDSETQKEPRLGFQLEPQSDAVLLTYTWEQSEDGAEQSEDDEKSSPISARFELAEIVAPTIFPDTFDAIAIADSEGNVLFQQSEPEIRLAKLDAVLKGVSEEAKLNPLGHATAVLEANLVRRRQSFLGDRQYTVFLQPITLRLPVSDQPIRWVACGIVSRDRLFAASLSASPMLVLLMVSLFPLAVASWPFLKLWLIAPRQRFSRADAVSLVFASLFGLSLLTLLICTSAFHSRTRAEVDRQLEELARVAQKELRFELLDAYLQLDCLDQLVKGKPGINRGLLENQKNPVDSLKALLIGQPIEKKLNYQHFHSIFWASSDGHDILKLPLRTGAELSANIAERSYFQCALSRAEGTPPETFNGDGDPAGALSAVHLVYTEAELREFRGSAQERKCAAECAAARLTSFSLRELEVCLELVRSNTTGRDLLVLAKESLQRPDLGIPVVALVTRLDALTQPVLAPGFGYAILDRDGKTLLHSDSRRSLNESFLKACDQSSVLRSLLDTRRRGDLSVSYLGRPHRAWVEPLVGMPYFLVTFRDTTDLRFRAFELIYDTSNGFFLLLLIQLVIIVGVAALAPLIARNDPLAILWPSYQHHRAYGWIILITPALLVGFALALALKRQILIFALSLLVPAFVLLAAGLLLLFDRYRASKAATKLQERTKSALSRYRFLPADRPVNIILAFFTLPPAMLLMSALLGSVEPEQLLHPPIIFLVLLAMLLLVSFAHWLIAGYFAAPLRRRAFTSALACVLFLLSVLPALGLFHIAKNRQLQFLTQEAQIHLARAIEQKQQSRKDQCLDRHRNADRLLQGLDPEDCSSPTDTRDPMPKFLKTFFETTLSDEPFDGGKEAKLPNKLFLWPHGDDLPSQPSWWAKLAIDRLSRRPVPLNSLTLQTYGTDLSRFGSQGQWTLENEGIRLDFRQRWGAGETLQLQSKLAGSLPSGLWPWFLTLGALAASAYLLALIARLIAERVLLIKMVGADRRQVFERVIEAVLRSATSEILKPARILLITGAPQLARPLLVSKGVECLSFPTIVAAYSSASKLWKKPGERPTALAIFDFKPDLGNATQAHQQIRALQELLEESLPLMLVTRTDPRMIQRRSGPQGDTEQLAIRRLWASQLAPFALRFARDAGSEDFRHALDSQLQARESEALEQRIVRRVRDRVYQECRPTRQLQHIGEQVIGDIGSALFTEQQVISKIRIMAQPYYQALWLGCSTDEKVALAQLAEEGVINPKSYDEVLSLTQKGLVVREPRLRLMNESFRRYIRRTVERTEILVWEQAEGPSPWSVLKWVLPLPLLLLGGFLFVTQRDAFSSTLGFVIAAGSAAPTLFNLYRSFQQATAIRQQESQEQAR